MSETKGSHVRSVVRFVGSGRVAIGTLFLLVPGASSRRLLASTRELESTKTFGRLTAGRDLAIGLGTLLSSWDHSSSETEWVLAGIIADTIDLYAFIKDDALGFLPRVLSGVVATSAIGLGAWSFMHLDALQRSPDLPEDPVDD